MNTLHDDALFPVMSRLPFDDDANFQRSYVHAARLRKERQIHPDKAELVQFAERLRNNPRLDDIIHRLKTTPYPNRKLMGVELNTETIADLLDRAINASLNAIQGEPGIWGPNEFREDDEKAAIARLIFRVIDAVLCPEQIENTPPYNISYKPRPIDAVNPSPAARIIETQETNDHRRLRFVFESNPVVNDRTRDLLKVEFYRKRDGGNQLVLDRDILITTESRGHEGQPFSVQQFVERLIHAEEIVEFRIGHQTPRMYSTTPIVDRFVITRLVRYILEEARLFHVADGRVMVSSAFSDLAI
jgi:hypothetical protein